MLVKVYIEYVNVLENTCIHAETLRLADKTIVFSEHEVFKVVAMVIR
jgi:hypothetical protein